MRPAQTAAQRPRRVGTSRSSVLTQPLAAQGVGWQLAHALHTGPHLPPCRQMRTIGTLSGTITAVTATTSSDSDDDDEAGGCVAMWDEEAWRHPSPVRAHLLEIDPGLNQNLISSATTVAQIFNQDMWERHRQPGRYLLNVRRMIYSTVLRRVFRPCAAITAIAAVLGVLNTAVLPLLPAWWVGPRQLAMSLAPHTLLGAALSLLLVFRTNSSFARFVDGRALWGALVRFSRDWTRLASIWMHGDLKGKAARYIQVLAFVLKSHLRGGRTRANPSDPSAFRDDPTAVVNELLPCTEAAAVLAQKNQPYYVICRMGQLAREAGEAGAPRHVQEALEHTISELTAVVGGCDRLLGTPIPLSYTRHTSRSLALWLATLPFALWQTTGWLTVPAIFFISFIFLGVDEIGMEIEEPFCILPLLPMCRTVVNDVRLAMAMPQDNCSSFSDGNGSDMGNGSSSNNGSNGSSNGSGNGSRRRSNRARDNGAATPAWK